MKRFAWACTASLALALSFGCKRQPYAASKPSSQVEPAGTPVRAPPSADRVVLDVARSLDSCELGYRGVLLDFGDPSLRASLRTLPSMRLLGQGDGDVAEREGATWLRVRSRTVSASFYWPAVGIGTPNASVYVGARIRGAVARTVGVSIDGKSIGVWTLAKDDDRVLVARTSSPLTLAPGGHELSLRFIGGSRASGEVLAEIDWVHVGIGAELGEKYAAPTRADVAVDHMAGDQSMRALSLCAPGFIRCSNWIPANATLEVSLSTAGGGDAEVEAYLLRDRRAPVMLGSAHVAGDAGRWVPWSVPVTGVEGDGALASIELVAAQAGEGTRVLFGRPEIVASGPAPGAALPAVRSAVLVVLGSTSSSALAPWGGSHAVPELSRLASSGTTFTANRASSSLPNAVVASMLTGLPPRVHGLDDPDARLPAGPVMVQEACREGGIATAMFTANPTTGMAFGFARGWDTFVSHDPLEDSPATRVFDDAAAWITAHRASRFFVVVHARGGHPPWDATPEELRTMPPEGYLGVIEPRRAAEALAKERAHPGRFKEDDRARAWALYDHAIDAHDEALGRFLAAIRAAGREDDTAVLVTADVAANEAPPVPFTETGGLDEPLLATPLVIRWPGVATLAGRRVGAPSSPIDLARTVLDALGLVPPAAFQGMDLATLAQGALVPGARPLVATRGGRFSIRWGPYVLIGAHRREVRVCDLSLDPTCVADVRATSPIALEALDRLAVDSLGVAAQKNILAPQARVPAVLDQHGIAALVRWGERLGDAREVDR